MRYHRTVGPPSKPGHGRGSAPYGQSDSTSRPWGGGQVGLLKNNAPSHKSLSRTWRWLLAWTSIGSLTSLDSARNFSACSRSYLNSGLDHRLTNQSPVEIRRIGGITAKNNELNACRREESLFCDVTLQHPHITCFHPRAPEDARTTHVVSEDKDQSNAFEGNENNFHLLTVNKQVPLTNLYCWLNW